MPKQNTISLINTAPKNKAKIYLLLKILEKRKERLQALTKKWQK